MRTVWILGLMMMQGTAKPHIIFVVDKVVTTAEAHNKLGGVSASAGEHHTAPLIMAEFARKCPAVTFTQDRSAAEFVLEGQPNGSLLMDSKGTVLYVSPALYLHNMVKDVCKFVSAR